MVWEFWDVEFIVTSWSHVLKRRFLVNIGVLTLHSHQENSNSTNSSSQVFHQWNLTAAPHETQQTPLVKAEIPSRIPRVDMQKKRPAILKISRNIKICHRSTSFWHVDGHSYVVFGMSMGTGVILIHLLVQSLSYHILSPNILACRRAHVILACGRAHFSISTDAFWHVDGHIYYFTLCYFSVPAYFLASQAVILACRRAHFGMSTGTFTTLHFAIFPFQPAFWHRGPSFWHVDRRILACRRAHLLFYTLLFFVTYFLASRAIILTCRRAHFGMSTGTFTMLHFTIFPFQPAFWHRGPSFWHVDGRILHVDGHIYYFTLYCLTPSLWHIDGHSFGMSTETIFFGMSMGTFFPCRRRQSCLACRRGQPFCHVDGRFGMLTRRIPIPNRRQLPTDPNKHLRPRCKGKRAGKVKGGKVWSKSIMWGIGRHEVKRKSDDADSADCDDMATMSKRVGLIHGKTASKKNRWGVVIGDWSPCQVSASRS